MCVAHEEGDDALHHKLHIIYVRVSARQLGERHERMSKLTVSLTLVKLPLRVIISRNYRNGCSSTYTVEAILLATLLLADWPEEAHPCEDEEGPKMLP